MARILHELLTSQKDPAIIIKTSIINVEPGGYKRPRSCRYTYNSSRHLIATFFKEIGHHGILAYGWNFDSDPAGDCYCLSLEYFSRQRLHCTATIDTATQQEMRGHYDGNGWTVSFTVLLNQEMLHSFTTKWPNV